GGRLPSLGLGTWKIPAALAPAVVCEAVRAGWRHFDCACDYGNERAVGAGLASALAEGLCRREEVWVTSKLWNTYHEPQHVRAACERSLRDLGLDVLDLYLVHFPIALAFVPFEVRYPPEWFHDPHAATPAMKPIRVPLAETWGAMEALVRTGLAKHIGVCNFGTSLLRDLLSYATIRPTVLQVEMHPYLPQQRLLRYCQEEGIAVTAFSPLGAESYVPIGMAGAEESVLKDPRVTGLARRHGRTPAQIVLRWGIQRGTAAIPKTQQLARIQENRALYDFELTDDEMKQITALDRKRRFNDPGEFGERAFNTFFPIFD
ncbi:MAG: aldo/keto reductase, partial [Planctomycetota bacterium]|nr:aldo/keto reductase [Planctomycetota bacterium]